MVQLIEVYDLIQSDIHRLGGELRIHTDSNGSKITLTGTSDPSFFSNPFTFYLTIDVS